MYWAVITLGPLLLIEAVRFAHTAHLAGKTSFLNSSPILHDVFYQLSSIVILCLAFAAFYMLMPNTKVPWQAALAGGVVAGLVWHLNNNASVLYASRIGSSSAVYGGLWIVPVFMAGLYFDWLIVLFGAQVAYAYENRAAFFANCSKYKTSASADASLWRCGSWNAWGAGFNTATRR